jgi:hypothetical protein
MPCLADRQNFALPVESQAETGTARCWGQEVRHKLTSPEAMRLTIEARREQAKALVQSGLSRRQAKHWGYRTIARDLGGAKSTTRQLLVSF